MADSDSDEEEQASHLWSRRDPGKVGASIPPFNKPVLSAADSARLDSLSTAYDFYKVFQSDGFADEILYQSRLYAVQKGHKTAMEQINLDTYRYVRLKCKCEEDVIFLPVLNYCT